MEHLFYRFGSLFLVLSIFLLVGCSANVPNVVSISEEDWGTTTITIKNDQLNKEISKKIADIKINESDNIDPCLGCAIYSCLLDNDEVIKEEYNGYISSGNVQGFDEAIIQEIYKDLTFRVPAYSLDEYTNLNIYYYEDDDLVINGELGEVFDLWSFEQIKSLEWLEEFTIIEDDAVVNQLPDTQGQHHVILEKDNIQYQLGYIVE